MPRRKTHEEFIEQLNKVHGEGVYIPLEKYINSQTKILIRHNRCGHEWIVIPNALLRGEGCPVCGKERRIQKQTKTHEEFVKEVKEKYGDEYEVLGEYINSQTKILVKHNCKKCNYHEYMVIANGFLRGNRCPVCANQKAVLGINTIWDTDRWMVDLGVSESDAKRYSSQSSKKIIVKCPNCGKDKNMIISSIYRNKSISCSCGDGKSYPEKFVLNVLEQLNIKYKKEYSPRWIDNKRYDFYISKLECIIETHGKQHYSNKTFDYCGGRVLEEEQQNDKLKKEIALQNGVKYYIELDCRESNMEYIKSSILNSELAKLFDLSNIDWKQCAKFANKNIVKEVCNYWNNKKDSETTIDVGEVFKINRNTVANYLKKGTKLGWCNYNPKEEMYKQGKLNGKSSKKKVEIFKDNQSLGVFESCTELSRLSEELFGVKLLQSKISSVCRGKRKQHKGFTFKHVIKHL